VTGIVGRLDGVTPVPPTSVSRLAKFHVLVLHTRFFVSLTVAVVGLAKLYEPSAEGLVGVQLVLATALSTILTVAWMAGYSDDCELHPRLQRSIRSLVGH